LFSDNIKIILLQESKIFSGFREFTFFHTFTNVPVDICSLGVHHVVLLGKSFGEDSVDSNVVSDHDSVSGGFSHVIIFLGCSWNVVKTNLETGWAPLDEGNFSLLLDPLDDTVGLLGFDVTSVVDGDGHVLVFDDVKVAVLDKEAVGLEAVISDSLAVVGFTVRLGLGDDWSKGGGHEVKSRERDKVGLELVHVNVQFTVESKSSSHGGDDFADDVVQVGVTWSLDVKLLLADFVQSFVVKDQRNIGVVQEPMGGQKSVVWLNDAG